MTTLLLPELAPPPACPEQFPPIEVGRNIKILRDLFEEAVRGERVPADAINDIRRFLDAQ